MGPNLTPKQRKKLEAEIAAFDKNRTLADIERNAVGKRDINAYHDWLESNGGVEPVAANPDLLIQQEPARRGVSLNYEMLTAKLLVSEILSFRQKQVWALCMKQGLSIYEAADKLNLKSSTVDSYLKSAKAKVVKHFNKD